MRLIKNIVLSIFTVCGTSVSCQEFWFPDEIWQPIIMYALINNGQDARNLFCVSKQIATLMSPPIFIKTVIANEMPNITSHYKIACQIHCPSITRPYIDANETLLHMTELTLYQKALETKPYADINYRGKGDMSKLAMICADYPEYKLNWITWLLEHGACDRGDWDPYKKYALGRVVEKCNKRIRLYHAHPTPSVTKQIKHFSDIAAMLLDKGANPNPYLHEVMNVRNKNLMHVFIKHDAPITKFNHVWFHDYVAKGNIDEDALKFLLDKGYNPNKRAWRKIEIVHSEPLDSALEVVEKFPPSAKKDRILELMRQYPKKQN
jgi:hypothetical protein